MANTRRGRPEALPPDNTARIVLYDAMAKASESDHAFDGLTETQLFDRVIPRLRVLVPRELHNHGEEPYVAAKIAGCLEAGVLQSHPRRATALLLGPEVPRIRYPDGTIRYYTAGLEDARERLVVDENRLRRGAFDVRRIIWSPADVKKSDRYRNLVASMREHGFLEDRPISESSTGVVLDGVARKAAAAEADVPLKDKHRRVRPRHRDTPLQQALFVLHLNADRLTEEEVAKVHEAIATRTERPWMAIEDDLELTREWRRAEPRDYSAKLDVRLVPYGDRTEAKVQVTTDGTRVMLPSVMREAGLPGWARDHLRPYVAFEDARTQSGGGGNKPIFVGIIDAIRGIERMQDDRTRRGLKVDPAWNDVRHWLLSFSNGRSVEGAPATATHPPAAGAAPPVNS